MQMNFWQSDMRASYFDSRRDHLAGRIDDQHGCQISKVASGYQMTLKGPVAGTVELRIPPRLSVRWQRQ